jgi:hypothetical protein
MGLSIDTACRKNDTVPELSPSPASEKTCPPELLSKQCPIISVKDDISSTNSTRSPDSARTLVQSDHVTYWNPTSLSRPVLAAFLALFVSMLASLQIIHSYSAKHQGLATADHGKHYLWTFGPTGSKLSLIAMLVACSLFNSPGGCCSTLEAGRLPDETVDAVGSNEKATFKCRPNYPTGLHITYPYCLVSEGMPKSPLSSMLNNHWLCLDQAFDNPFNWSARPPRCSGIRIYH